MQIGQGKQEAAAGSLASLLVYLESENNFDYTEIEMKVGYYQVEVRVNLGSQSVAI